MTAQVRGQAAAGYGRDAVKALFAKQPLQLLDPESGGMFSHGNRYLDTGCSGFPRAASCLICR